jgi:hypothetical protein
MSRPIPFPRLVNNPGRHTPDRIIKDAFHISQSVP